jgi:hypothetical protein
MAKQLTIRQAAQSGSINRKEAQQLINQGVSASRIQSVASNQGATIRSGASNVLSSAINTGASRPATAPATQSTSAPGGPLAQYANNGNFGGTAFTNARNAGMSEQQIRDAIPSSGLTIGQGVQTALNPGQYDSNWASNTKDPLVKQGYYGSGLASQDGNNYKSQAYVLPFAVESGIGPGKNVLFMADPGQNNSSYQDRLNFLTGTFGGSKIETPGGAGAATPGTTAAATENAQRNTSYKGIKNIRQGLAIGQNSTISNKEANRIAKNTGRTYDQVLAKGLELGFDVSAKAVNKSNQRYNKSLPMMMGPDSFYGKLLGSQDPLAAMRNQKVNKGYSYQGVAVKDGPGLFGRKNVSGVNPLGIRTKQTSAGGGDAPVTTNTGGTNTTNPAPTPTDLAAPELPLEDLKQESSITGPGGLLGGGAGATGATGLRRARGRLRQLGIQNRGTALLGRGLQYGNALNR